MEDSEPSLVEDLVFSLMKKDQLLPLAQTIKNDPPSSAPVYNSLLLHARGHRQDYQFYTLRNHPHAHVVLSLYKTQNTKVVVFYCLEEELKLLMTGLQITTIVDLTKSLGFHHLSEHIYSDVNLILQNNGATLRVHPCDGYLYNPLAHKQDIWCPAGHRVCSLGDAGVRHMFNTWLYSYQHNIEQYLDFSKSSPAVGVYLDASITQSYVVHAADLPVGGHDEKAVAWIVMSDYGSLGLLMTDEGHRRKGLASLVTQVCARLAASQGYLVNAYVEDYNAGSKKLFSSLHGWSCTHRGNWIYSMFNNSFLPKEALGKTSNLLQ